MQIIHQRPSSKILHYYLLFMVICWASSLAKLTTPVSDERHFCIMYDSQNIFSNALPEPSRCANCSYCSPKQLKLVMLITPSFLRTLGFPTSHFVYLEVFKHGKNVLDFFLWEKASCSTQIKCYATDCCLRLPTSSKAQTCCGQPVLELRRGGAVNLCFSSSLCFKKSQREIFNEQ